MCQISSGSRTLEFFPDEWVARLCAKPGSPAVLSKCSTVWNKLFSTLEIVCVPELSLISYYWMGSANLVLPNIHYPWVSRPWWIVSARTTGALVGPTLVLPLYLQTEMEWRRVFVVKRDGSRAKGRNVCTTLLARGLSEEKFSPEHIEVPVLGFNLNHGKNEPLGITTTVLPKFFVLLTWRKKSLQCFTWLHNIFCHWKGCVVAHEFFLWKDAGECSG